MLEVGKSYYFISHAYYHYIATVREVTGKRSVTVGPHIAVHSCGRGWTAFFNEGLMEDTRYSLMPAGGLDFIKYFEWNHGIPTTGGI